MPDFIVYYRVKRGFGVEHGGQVVLDVDSGRDAVQALLDDFPRNVTRRWKDIRYVRVDDMFVYPYDA